MTGYVHPRDKALRPAAKRALVLMLEGELSHMGPCWKAKGGQSVIPITVQGLYERGLVIIVFDGRKKPRVHQARLSTVGRHVANDLVRESIHLELPKGGTAISVEAQRLIQQILAESAPALDPSDIDAPSVMYSGDNQKNEEDMGA